MRATPNIILLLGCRPLSGPALLCIMCSCSLVTELTNRWAPDTHDTRTARHENTQPGRGLPGSLCCAMVLPGRNPAFRAGFRPESSREGFKIGLPAGREADFDVFPIRIRPKSCPGARFPARRQYILRNRGYTRNTHGARVYPVTLEPQSPGWQQPGRGLPGILYMLRNGASGPETGLPGRISAGF